jgi:hypothetical protein
VAEDGALRRPQAMSALKARLDLIEVNAIRVGPWRVIGM